MNRTAPSIQASARLVMDHRRSLRARLVHDSTLPERLVERLWANPDQLITEGIMLKDGDRCTVVRIDSFPNVGTMVFKRYNLKGRFHTMVHRFMRSRARWCWQSAELLRDAGLPTPRPLAYLEERRGMVLRERSYLLTEFIPGVSLGAFLTRRDANESTIRDLADQFCRIWRELNALRLGHGDMKATNFIVDPEARLWLIDLDGMRTYPRGPMLRADRRKDITRFMRNWQETPEVAAIFRARIGTG